MSNWYSRPVFFVRNVELAIEFYTQKLDFTLAWNHSENGKILVAQVSRFDLEIILTLDEEKCGKGRIFISLEEEETEFLKTEIEAKSIDSEEITWGMPVIKILDVDGNELFFTTV
ncbi:MAG: glyoxalase [Calditrichaeota bacterium]|nr:MAG: glyoxalase [Calditrichota bacterium]